MSQYYIIDLRKSFSLSFILSFLGIFLFFLFYSHNYENQARRRVVEYPWLTSGGTQVHKAEESENPECRPFPALLQLVLKAPSHRSARQ